MRKINKKAQGHVEIMLSFVLFIGALIFIFIFLNPFSKAGEKISVVDKIEKAVFQNITKEVGKLSVIVDAEGNCYDFVKSNYNGNYHEVYEGDRKYNIYFSDMFSDFSLDKEEGCLADYTLGVYSQEEFVVWENVEEMKNNYETGYSELKSSLGILYDFSFSLKNIGSDEEISLLTPIPKQPSTGVDAESKDILIRIINSNAEIKEMILNIKVW